MKTFLKIIGSLLIGVAVLLVILRITGFEPKDCASAGVSWRCRVPGLWLKGNLVTTPVADWSFTDQYQNAKVQTREWFGLPHSVTTYCVSHNGQLYLTSIYRAGLTYPHGRHWNENVARDPHVRIKIGDQLYDRTLVYVTDPAERAAVIHDKAKKYPKQVVRSTEFVNVFRVVPDDQSASN